MSDNSRLLVIERLIAEGNEPSDAKLFDINMLVMLGACERSRIEYQALLEEAGFQLTRVLSTRSPISLLEAAPR